MMRMITAAGGALAAFALIAAPAHADPAVPFGSSICEDNGYTVMCLRQQGVNKVMDTPSGKTSLLSIGRATATVSYSSTGELLSTSDTAIRTHYAWHEGENQVFRLHSSQTLVAKDVGTCVYQYDGHNTREGQVRFDNLSCICQK